MSNVRMRRAATAVLAMVLAGSALAGCAKSQTGSGANNPTATSSGAGSLGDSGNQSAPPTPAAPTYPSTAAAYAQAGVAAYVNHDAARLDQLEVAGGQLHTMAGCNGCYNTAFALVNCQGAAGSSYCLFFNAVGDELNVHLQNDLLGSPDAIVAGSIFSPITFPSDDKAYAQEALNAWLSKNDARLKLLTQANFTSAQVDALGANRNSTWTFDHGEGAAGSLYFSWRDGSGHTLAFRFLNGPAAPTTGPASQHRITDIVYMP
jgi:hypothetical protein